MINRAYYHAKIKTFVSANPTEILGELTSHHHFELDIPQRHAWVHQITTLKIQLSRFEDGDIFFEFSIPRMGKRVDVLLLIGGIVFVVEYKVGAKTHEKYAIDQVMDYALDLKNFHEGSHDLRIVPILVSANDQTQRGVTEWSDDGVAAPLMSNGDDFAEIVQQALSEITTRRSLNGTAWANSGYKPTPTIVEAAQALYQGHSVDEISRSEAGATNLTRTAKCISEIIELSKRNLRKSICFVTGVPGAGKTLAGLNIVSQRLKADDRDGAVFLSGNGPLVLVLREALARDEVSRAAENGQKLSKKKTASKVNAFVQNIHHFRDEEHNSVKAPPEHIVVFDEAQRAWDRKHAEKFMARKRGVTDFGMSEPEFLISVMDRREDWCTVICLIGGGQEINMGEAGLVEWFEALKKRFTHWDVFYPIQIAHKNYSWGQQLASKLAGLRSEVKEALHLGVSVRSFRAEKLSTFVGAVIDGDVQAALELHNSIQNDYPMALTRDLRMAREWIKGKARGSERCGLVASSGAIRLQPEGIAIKTGIDPIMWFLNDKDDIRSSYYLEDVATEFDIQGLELDWIGICWDADFRRERNDWCLYDFKGKAWQKVNDTFRRAYLANAYRVLLTRARQGMVIFVPRGDAKDHTRPPKFYDETYEFLLSCGIREC